MITVLFVSAAAVVAAILFVPFRLTLRGAFDGRFEGDIVMKWLWGVVSAEYMKNRREISILLCGRPLFHFRRPHFKKENHRHSFGAFNPSFEGAVSILHKTPSLIGPIRKTLHSMSARGQIRLIIGLGDPAETGLCAGLLASGLAAIPLPVSVEPDFARERYVAQGRLSIHIVIWRLILILAGWLLSPSGRNFRSYA